MLAILQVTLTMEAVLEWKEEKDFRKLLNVYTDLS